MARLDRLVTAKAVAQLRASLDASSRMIAPGGLATRCHDTCSVNWALGRGRTCVPTRRTTAGNVYL